jgi:hypothetical protein
METKERRWQKAFAKQSLSDLEVYGHLCTKGRGLPHCHRLHYLQMHLEKLAKAFCWSREDLQKSIPRFDRIHSVVARVLPIVVRARPRAGGYDARAVRLRLAEIREICREIDLLAPAVKDGENRPDNSEYPWPSRDGTSIIPPCEHKFRIDSRLGSPAGKMLLKIAIGLTQELATS